MPPAERLQKILSAAGVASRRASEELIAAGRVTVDGRRAELGDRADPVTAVIHVDGERVVTDASRVYLAMNKPRGVVSTMDDERGRAALADYLPASAQRVYHVGRLDADSEGLLLLTNDGDLANKLMHPSYEVKKTYLCQITGPVPRGLGRQLRSGVELDDGPARADSFRVVDSAGRNVLVEFERCAIHHGDPQDDELAQRRGHRRVFPHRRQEFFPARGDRCTVEERLVQRRDGAALPGDRALDLGELGTRTRLDERDAGRRRHGGDLRFTKRVDLLKRCRDGAHRRFA